MYFVPSAYLIGGFSLAFFNSSEVQRETGSVLCHGNSSVMGLFLERYRFHYWLFRSCAGNCVQNSSPKIVPQCNSRHYRPSLSSASSKWPKRYRKGLVIVQLHLSGVCWWYFSTRVRILQKWIRLFFGWVTMFFSSNLLSLLVASW